MPNRRRAHRILPAAAFASATFLACVAIFAVDRHLKDKTQAGYEPQVGDVVFQSLPHLPLVDAIEGCTKSPYSHCGIVFKDGRTWKVYEALGSVRATPLDNFLKQGRRRAFAVYRLTKKHRTNIPRTLTEVAKMQGRPYDIRYRMDDEAIYCSELIYKAHLAATGQPLGKLVRLGDLAWRPHEALIRKIEGGALPLDRQMITPRDLAAAPELSLVFDKGGLAPRGDSADADAAPVAAGDE